MEVIDRGRRLDGYYFYCENCGCIFFASLNEEGVNNDGPDDVNAVCPECKNVTYKNSEHYCDMQMLKYIDEKNKQEERFYGHFI